jgi:hypothetical protein
MPRTMVKPAGGRVGRALLSPPSFSLLALLLRALVPSHGLDAKGAAVWIDVFLSLALLLGILIQASWLGRRILRLIRLPELGPLGNQVLSLSLGLGAMAYAVAALAFMGWLNAKTLSLLLLLLGLLGLLTWPPENRPALTRTLLEARHAWRRATGLERSILIVGASIAGLSLLHTLGPLWDYDGLAYHVLGARLFLEAGGFYPNPDNLYVNGPFAIEMLFTFGLAFGDEIIPKLLHHVYGWLFILATAATARRWLGRHEAWLAAAALLSIPILPVWSSFAYIDLGWALYEFLAMAALASWAANRQRGWLLLAGICLGFAMGSKYLGLQGLLVAGILLAYLGGKKGWRNAMRHLAWSLIPALLIASPWYIKNLLWFGNPVFPFFFGGPGWDSQRLELYEAYLYSFGTGREWIDWLLLPLNLYIQRQRFGAVMNTIDFPSPLFPLVLIYPWRRAGHPLSVVLAAAGLRALLWTLGSQQTRFLLPIYPALAIGAAWIMGTFSAKAMRRSPREAFFPLLTVGLMLITLFYQIQVILQYGPQRSYLGAETRREFLRRTVWDFGATEHLLTEPEEKRALLLGDGRSYYCHPRCIPDPDHYRWAAGLANLPDAAAFSAWLRSQGAGLILLSWEDADFLLQHDPKGVMQTALLKVVRWKAEGCFRVIYSDRWTEILEPTC